MWRIAQVHPSSPVSSPVLPLPSGATSTEGKRGGSLSTAVIHTPSNNGRVVTMLEIHLSFVIHLHTRALKCLKITIVISSCLNASFLKVYEQQLALGSYFFRMTALVQTKLERLNKSESAEKMGCRAAKFYYTQSAHSGLELFHTFPKNK